MLQFQVRSLELHGPWTALVCKIWILFLDIQKCIDACRRNKIFYGDELVQVKTFNHVSGMKRYGSMESNPHECKICTALNCNRHVHKIL